MGLRERPVLYKMRVGIVSLQRVPTLYGVIRQIVLVLARVQSCVFEVFSRVRVDK